MKLQFLARLLYDSEHIDNTEKEVDYLKSKPLEYRTYKSESGDTAAIECRLHCLSSQHSTFFRLKLSVVDPLTKETVYLMSNPLKVVAKASSVRKKVALQQQKLLPTSPSNEIPATPSSPSVLSGKKHGLEGDVVDRLSRLEQQSKAQQELLQQILMYQKIQAVPQVVEGTAFIAVMG